MINKKVKFIALISVYLLAVPLVYAESNQNSGNVSYGMLAQEIVRIKGLSSQVGDQPTDAQCIDLIERLGLSPAKGTWEADKSIHPSRDLAPVLVAAMRGQAEVEKMIDNGEVRRENAYVAYLEKRGIQLVEPVTQDFLKTILQSADFKDPLLSQPAVIVPPEIELDPNLTSSAIASPETAERTEMQFLQAMSTKAFVAYDPTFTPALSGASLNSGKTENTLTDVKKESQENSVYAKSGQSSSDAETPPEKMMMEDILAAHELSDIGESEKSPS